MKSKERLEHKKNHDRIRDINMRISKGQPTTFFERNIASIYHKRIKTKRIRRSNIGQTTGN
jgi:hypothetical protein